MLISLVQTHTQAKRHQNHLKTDVASSTSILSASPAIVHNASVLDLKYVFICWCEYYLTLSSTQILLGLCIPSCPTMGCDCLSKGRYDETFAGEDGVYELLQIDIYQKTLTPTLRRC